MVESSFARNGHFFALIWEVSFKIQGDLHFMKLQIASFLSCGRSLAALSCGGTEVSNQAGSNANQAKTADSEQERLKIGFAMATR